MQCPKKILFIALTLLTSGCFETKEEAELRHKQFNGKTISDVSAVIGKPTSLDRNKAIWRYEDTYYKQVPYQVYQSGIWITLYRSERVRLNCIYTATLNAGRIKTSNYQGNACRKFSPKIKKQAK